MSFYFLCLWVSHGNEPLIYDFLFSFMFPRLLCINFVWFTSNSHSFRAGSTDCCALISFFLDIDSFESSSHYISWKLFLQISYCQGTFLQGLTNNCQTLVIKLAPLKICVVGTVDVTNFDNYGETFHRLPPPPPLCVLELDYQIAKFQHLILCLKLWNKLWSFKRNMKLLWLLNDMIIYLSCFS